MTFPCMEPENYAAVAKKLHDTALIAESTIHDMEQRLRSAVNRPTLVQMSTGADSGIQSILDYNISPPVTTLFVNFPMQPGDTVFNDAGPFITLGEGIYEIGWTGNVIPSGVIDTNTFRTFKFLQVRPDSSSLISPTIAPAGITLYEANTGNGMDFSFSAIMRVKPLDTVLFTIAHGNTSSTLTLNSASLFWMHKLSDVDLTVVL